MSFEMGVLNSWYLMFGYEINFKLDLIAKFAKLEAIHANFALAKLHASPKLELHISYYCIL